MCNCIVEHLEPSTEKWALTLQTYRQVSDRGDGSMLPLLAEQLFGSCPTREEK